MTARSAASSVRELRLAGFAATIFYSHPELRDKLDPWLDLFVPEGIPGGAGGNDAAARGSQDARLEFDFSIVPDGSIPPAPAGARPLIEYLYVSGLRENDRAIFLGTDGSTLEADPAGGRAVCRVPLSAAGGPPWVVRDLFNAAFSTFLRARGLHPLHAAAVTRGEQAVLIAAPSMSGKSWLAVNFVRRGWSWLGDDKVLLSREPSPGGGNGSVRDSAGPPGRIVGSRNGSVRDSAGPPAGRIVTGGLVRHFNLDPALARYFPELSPIAHQPALYPHSDKRGVDLETYYGEGRRPACYPGIILLPQVVDPGATRLEPVDANTAFLELLRQTPIMNDPPTARNALDLLARLVATTRAFRLGMGRDLLENPHRLTALGREIGIDIGPEPPPSARAEDRPQPPRAIAETPASPAPRRGD